MKREDREVYMYDSLPQVDRFTHGWIDADYAIKHKCLGHKDYSQGQGDWDKGWNARLDEERNLVDETGR